MVDHDDDAIFVVDILRAVVSFFLIVDVDRFVATVIIINFVVVVGVVVVVFIVPIVGVVIVFNMWEIFFLYLLW